MHEIRIEGIKIVNWKGVRGKAVLSPKGKSISIFGENGAGKSTWAKAVHWCLFGSAPDGKEDAEIKFRDPAGNIVDGELNHTVEVTLSINGESTVFGRTMTETHTKKRGAPDKKLQGHEFTRTIDGASKSEKDFTAALVEIATIETWRMLMNPAYFCESLPWKTARERLLAVCGDITPMDVIASNPMLADLSLILGKQSPEDKMSVVKADLARTKKSTSEIPARIDEQKRIPDVEPVDVKSAKATLIYLQSQLKDEQSTLQRIESGGEIAEKKKRLSEIQSELLDLATEERKGRDEGLNDSRKRLTGLRQSLSTEQSTVDAQKRAVARIEAEIEEKNDLLPQMRMAYMMIRDSVYTGAPTDCCPECGAEPENQPLHSLERFNVGKVAKLEENSSLGKQLKAEITELENQKVKAASALEEALVAERDANTAVEALQLEIRGMEDSPIPDSPARLALISEKNEVDAALSDLAIGSRDAISVAKGKITDLEGQIQNSQNLIASADEAAKNTKKKVARIKELEKEETDLAAQIDNLENQQYLIEQFWIAQAKLLDERVNHHFQPEISFQLFRPLINGGNEPICVVMWQGKPYATCSTSERLKLGLGIIRTLERFNDVAMPVFIDEAESTSDIPATDGQQIRLIVSQEDKTLRIVED